MNRTPACAARGSCASLVWTSDLEGQFGNGTEFMAPLTIVGKHTITLTATDTDGNKGVTSITQIIE